MRVILAFVDCILIIFGVLMGEVLRFGEQFPYILMRELSVWKMIAFVFVIQICFYYFDLYKLTYLRKRKKMALLLLEKLRNFFPSIGGHLLLCPTSGDGSRDIRLESNGDICAGFLWRLIFARSCRNLIKQKILIVGTGALSQKILGDIYENGRDSFEIIGFVEE